MNKHGLYDIRGTWHVPFWQTVPFKFVLAIVVVAIIIGTLFLVIKKRRARQQSLPYWVVAERSIQDLKKGGLVNGAHGKEFYLALTGILKKYLQDRYGIDLQGKTDDEVVCHLKTEHFDIREQEILQEIFSGMTTIKFANVHGAHEQIQCDWQRSLAFIQKTSPRTS